MLGNVAAGKPLGVEWSHPHPVFFPPTKSMIQPFCQFWKTARKQSERLQAKLLGQLLLVVLCGGMNSAVVLGRQNGDSSQIDPQAQQREDHFENHIRPLLTKNCISCHGQVKREGNLDLSSIDGILRGGDSGPAIVSGKPEESLMMEAVRHQSLEMPPDRKLEDKLVQPLAQWIADGAHWPRGQVLKVVSEITEEDRQWWCMQPIRKPNIPQLDNLSNTSPIKTTWARNEIDNFIGKRLQSEGLTPANQASPLQLYRRIHFALTGLPPTEVPQASYFEAADWYESLVDQLLAEKSYGENQARYWLDLVRYADSDGYRADALRPAAQQYRDYVIASFNQDKPYDRFVMEQLAGDEIAPHDRDSIVGTMFLRHWIYEHNQRDVEGQWQEILDDVTETTADAFLALGLKCARCHDHKYDPLLQKDFFRLQAYFAAMHPREDVPVATIEERQAYNQQYEAWDKATRQLRLAIYEIENQPLLAHATREGFDKFVPEIKAMVLKQPYERTPHEHQIATLAQRQYDLVPEKLPEWLDKEKLAARQKLLDELATFDAIKPKPLPTQGFAATDVGPVAPPTWIVGDASKTPVEPGPPTIVDGQPAEIQAPPQALQTTGRRTALAKWIVSPENPLTARVIVNRIWEQHFGVGLAENASDFGRLGEKPSHPELLDWLAINFMEEGWSIKKLHRLILNSATYRQASQTQESGLPQTGQQLSTVASRVDPSNRLLWKMNPRRLSGEEVVDSMLLASGELKSGTKRAIYEKVMRNNLHPIASLFDFPDRIRSVSKRHRTTTSTQALLLMNNDWMRQRSLKVLESLKDLDTAEFVQQVHMRLLARSASAQELAEALEFIQQYAAVSPEPETKGAAEPSKAEPSTVDTTKAVLAKSEPKSTDTTVPPGTTADKPKPIDPANEPIVGASGKPKPKEDAKSNAKVDNKAADKEKKPAPEPILSPQDQARLALIHAMFSSNEMIYID